MSASSPPQMLREPVRELLRKRGKPIAQDIRLQDRGDEVRMPLIKAAYEQYDEAPETVTQWYDPEQNAVVIPLPDPEVDDTNQANLQSFAKLNLQANGNLGGSDSESANSKRCQNQGQSQSRIGQSATEECER